PEQALVRSTRDDEHAVLVAALAGAGGSLHERGPRIDGQVEVPCGVLLAARVTGAGAARSEQVLLDRREGGLDRLGRRLSDAAGERDREHPEHLHSTRISAK